MPSFASRAVACVAVALGPLALSACPRVADLGEVDLSTCDDGFGSGGSGLYLDFDRSVDILFVIDNSGSMAEEQVRLNEAAAALFAELDAADIDYRIGFTTTDNGNPWCPAGVTTPEGGKLVLSSCTTRLDDFLFNNGEVDAQDLACVSQCALDESELAITPTATSVDPELAPRPWLERSRGVTNLAAGVDPVEAFKCFAPQGINGCGFESPLESMYLGLKRFGAEGEASHGFRRRGAALAVVLVSDEADCSYNKDWAEIFEQDGNHVFWEDPGATFPSSALCWNAGVECSGDPSLYDGCEPANKAVNGQPSANDADAVLHPMSRYFGLLEQLEQEMQEFNADRELLVHLIAGVEGGGASWSVSYADALDSDVQLSYGIGPGCTDALGAPAVPPVRMRSLAETFDPEGLWSICAPDYGPAMASLGQRIADQMGPSCVYGCVADGDRSTPQLEPSCRLYLSSPGNDSEVVRECARAFDGAYLVDADTGDYQLPDGVDLCFAALADADGSQTVDPNDDLSETCAATGNLEYVIEMRPGAADLGPVSISASCDYSDCRDQDCPD